MTDHDDAPDAENALRSLEEVEDRRGKLQSALQDERAYQEDAQSDLRAASELITQLQDQLRGVEGCIDAALEAGDAAFGVTEDEMAYELDRLREYIDATADGPDGEPAGEIEIDGQRYDVVLVPQADESFGEWLADVLNGFAPDEWGSPESFLVSESLVSRARLKDILNGKEPHSDEGPSILKTLHESGVIDANDREYAEGLLEDD